MYKKQILTLIFAATFSATGWCQTQPSAAAPILDIKHFVVEGDNPLSAQETQGILAKFLGPHSDLASIEAAATTLERVIRERGHAFHRVIVPAQKPADGELKLQVLRFTLNDVAVTGNKYFSRENILRALPSFTPGTSPDVRELGRQITLANEHPAKRMTVQFRESAKRDHIDAEVKVRDVPTSQTFIGLTGNSRDFDNTLNRNTGYTRLTIGHQQSNLFDRDHALTLAYTTSPDHLDKVSQFGAFYWMPLYGYHTSLSAYWTKSDIDTGSIGVGGVDFAVSGKGEFYGLRATHALPKMREIAHSVSLAIDSRYFESSIGFAGGALPTNAVGSLPVSLRYTARSDQSWGGVGGYAEYVHNLGGGRANDAASYATARTSADRQWNAWRWELEAQYLFSNRWNLTGKLRGQYTGDALIPGEQFGLGGIGSVRGLKEREVTGDRGHTLNIELASPPVAQGLVPYLFTDYGYRKHLAPVVGVPTEDSATSAGAGVRWSWEKGLDVSITYAHVLSGVAGGTPRGHDKLLFSLFYRF